MKEKESQSEEDGHQSKLIQENNSLVSEGNSLISDSKTNNLNLDDRKKIDSAIKRGLGVTKDKKKAEDLMADLKKSLEGSDVDDIKKKTEELNKVAMDLAAKVYENAAKEKQNEEDAKSKDDTKEKVLGN